MKTYLIVTNSTTTVQEINNYYTVAISNALREDVRFLVTDTYKDVLIQRLLSKMRVANVTVFTLANPPRFCISPFDFEVFKDSDTRDLRMAQLCDEVIYCSQSSSTRCSFFNEFKRLENS